MANQIQIKRSATVGTPSSLQPGELAYSNNASTGSGVLYVGSTDGATVVPIGGVRTPGTLTANQAIVVNASKAIDEIRVTTVANLAAIYANGSLGTVGQVLTSNATQGLYWSTISTGATGSTTQIQFNDGGALNATAGFTFTKTTNTVTVGTGGSFLVGNFLANSTVVNTGTFQVGTLFTANSTVVNAASYTVGSTFVANATNMLVGGTGTSNGVNANTTTVFVGNNTVSTTINATSFSGTALTANNASYLGTVAAASYQLTGSTLSSNIAAYLPTYIGIVNAASHTVGTSFVANSTYVTLGTIGAANGFSVNSTALVFGNTSNQVTINSTTINATSYTIGTAFTANSTKVVFTGANVDITSAVLRVQDAVISGNLTVSGTTTLIDTTNLSVKDNVIILADQQASTATFADTVDAGFAIQTGNTLNTYYHGLARIAASSTNTNPYFKLFGNTTTAPGASAIDTAATTGTLQSYLQPYGTGTAFVVNSTAIAVTANATVSVSITANTVSIPTGLTATSGGTGQNTYALGDVLVGGTNSLTKLSISGTSNGYMLQSNGTTVVYSQNLDCGTF